MSIRVSVQSWGIEASGTARDAIEWLNSIDNKDQEVIISVIDKIDVDIDVKDIECGS